MYSYVKCPTCGCLLGHLYRLFQEMRAIKNVSDEEEKDLIDVFKILGIANYCCKTHVMSSRQFIELTGGHHACIAAVVLDSEYLKDVNHVLLVISSRLVLNGEDLSASNREFLYYRERLHHSQEWN